MSIEGKFLQEDLQRIRGFRLMDADITEPGEKLENLEETYVVFITENDVLGKGLPLYHIDRVIAETGDLFGDEAHILYVNGAYRDDSPVGWGN